MSARSAAMGTWRVRVEGKDREGGRRESCIGCARALLDTCNWHLADQLGEKRSVASNRGASEPSAMIDRSNGRAL